MIHLPMRAQYADRLMILQWINALRSGEYKPVNGTLKVHFKDEGGERFCCLGVLTDMVEPKGWNAPDLDTCSVPFRDTIYGQLPPTIQFRIGLKTTDGHFNVAKLPRKLLDQLPKDSAGYPATKLISVNDRLHCAGINPFPIIADILEFGLTTDIGLFERFKDAAE